MESITCALPVEPTRGASPRAVSMPAATSRPLSHDAMTAYTYVLPGTVAPFAAARVRGTTLLTDVDGHQACAPPD